MFFSCILTCIVHKLHLVCLSTYMVLTTLLIISLLLIVSLFLYRALALAQILLNAMGLLIDRLTACMNQEQLGVYSYASKFRKFRRRIVTLFCLPLLVVDSECSDN